MSDPAREVALAELKDLLAELRERVLNPLLSAAAEPPGVWTPPAVAGPAEHEFLEAVLEHRRGGTALMLPVGTTVEFAGSVTQRCALVVGRLCWLLGLSDVEREFVLAAASADPGEAETGLAAYADWLEERGRGEEGGVA